MIQVDICLLINIEFVFTKEGNVHAYYFQFLTTIHLSIAKWNLLQWGALLCSHCRSQMHFLAVIEDAPVIERILGQIGLWDRGINSSLARGSSLTPTSTIFFVLSNQLIW